MMTPSTRAWLATFVTVVFVAGAFAGVVVDRLWLLPDGGVGRPGSGPGRGGGPGSGRGGIDPIVQSPARVVADLDARLSLSDEQEAAIRRILDDWRPRVQDLQDSTRQQFVETQRLLRQEIAATLTPDQLERFQSMGPGPLDGGRGPRGGSGPGRGPRGRRP